MIRPNAIRDRISTLLILARWTILWCASRPCPFRRSSRTLITLGNSLFPESVPNETFDDFSSYVAQYPCSLSIYSDISRCLSLNELEGKDVVDLGSGLGQYSALLASLPTRQVIGIEYQQSKADFATRIFTSSKISFVCGAAESIPLPDKSADIVFSHTVFEHLFDIPRALSECRRILRPGGILLVSFNHIHHRGGHHLFPYIHFPWPLAIVNEYALCSYWSQCLRSDQDAGHMGFYAKHSSIRSLSEGGEIHLNRISELEFRRQVRSSGLILEKANPADHLFALFPRCLRRSRLLPYLRGTVVYRIRKPVTLHERL